MPPILHTARSTLKLGLVYVPCQHSSSSQTFLAVKKPPEWQGVPAASPGCHSDLPELLHQHNSNACSSRASYRAHIGGQLKGD